MVFQPYRTERHSCTDGLKVGFGVSRCLMRSFILSVVLYLDCCGYFGNLYTPFTIPTALESTKGWVK